MKSAECRFEVPSGLLLTTKHRDRTLVSCFTPTSLFSTSPSTMFSTDIPTWMGALLALLSCTLVYARLKRLSNEHSEGLPVSSYNVVHKPDGKTMKIQQQQDPLDQQQHGNQGDDEGSTRYWQAPGATTGYKSPYSSTPPSYVYS